MAEERKDSIAFLKGWSDKALSITFGKGPSMQESHRYAAELLDKKGFKGTFYIVPGNFNESDSTDKWSYYKSLAENGHEIGSHTNQGKDNLTEYKKAKLNIEEHIGEPCVTHAYWELSTFDLNSDNYKEHVDSATYYFIAATAPFYDHREVIDAKNIDYLDIYKLPKFGFMYDSPISTIKKAGSLTWNIFKMGDDLYSEDGGARKNRAQFDSLLNYVDTVSTSKIWVAPVRDVAMYIRVRAFAKLERVHSELGSVTYSLTTRTVTPSFCLPYDSECRSKVLPLSHNNLLSIRIALNDNWRNVKVIQRDTTKNTDISIDVVIKDGYAYFDAVPNIGEIVVSFTYPYFSIEKTDNGKNLLIINGDYESKEESVNIGSAVSTEVDSIEYLREFTPLTPATIIFPFSLGSKAVFNGMFYDLKEVVQDGNRWKATMQYIGEDEKPKANTPYVFIINSNQNKLWFSLRTTKAAIAEPKADTTWSSDKNWYFTGTYAYKEWKKGDPELGLAYAFAGSYENNAAKGQFGKIQAGAYAYPMRAYLAKKDASVQLKSSILNSPSALQKSPAMAYTVEFIPEYIDIEFVKSVASIDGSGKNTDSTTAIGQMNPFTGEIRLLKTNRTYDLKGRRVNGEPSARGIYLNR